MARGTVDNILDAAVSCFRRDGIDAVTMSDIIAESGQARTTIYRHFPAKDDVISQVVLRDIDHLVKSLESVYERYASKSLEQQLYEVMAFTITEICKRPLLTELFSQDPIRVNRLGLSNESVVKYSQQATRRNYELIKASGRLHRDVTLEDFSDWTRRLIMSFVITPYRDQDNPQKMKRYVKSFIVPSLLAV